jgi:ribosomal protein L11 methylase PrmA
MTEQSAARAQQIWYAVEVTLAPAAREAVEYALMEAGALGTEATDENGTAARVTAYFGAPPLRERISTSLFDALRIYELPALSITDVQWREVANRDWLEEWKSGWKKIHHRAALERNPSRSGSNHHSHRTRHGLWHRHT